MQCISECIVVVTIPFLLLEFKLKSMRGIGILVTCDYRGYSGKCGLQLPATSIDADEMRLTFEKLGYDIHERRNENVTKDEINTLLADLCTYLQKYDGKLTNPDGSEKVIAFAFSGNGGPDNNQDKDSISLLTYDGENLSLKGSIMRNLIPHVFEIPKLFFIDASRGLQQMTKKAAIEDEGNYRIDYSTIPDHVACSNGIKWMAELACKLRDETLKRQSLQNVAAIVKKSVQKGGLLQQCESIDRLITGPLYLHPVISRKT